MMHRRLALLLEYDGADFAGSQSQSGQRTVQDVVEDAWCEFTGERLRVAFAGRTDAGVHARGQVVAFNTAALHGPATCRRALNHFLPPDVAVWAVAQAAAGFDPRRDARSRVYRYELRDGGERSPLARRHAWLVERPLDERAMAAAAALLPLDEERDWAAFGGAVPEGYPTVRRLSRCAVRRCGPQRLAVTLEASGFLPQQVRRMVGALERAGAGRITPAQFARLIDGPPGSVGPVAPPQGLTLLEVRYAPGTVMWDDDQDLPAQ
ncbi:MAG: tRNA pseudouridine synthase A [Dehalococcoidia bacterium]|nr:tRNA pseudouridine synthase A [Dehalococcoidia bacterium]